MNKFELKLPRITIWTKVVAILTWAPRTPNPRGIPVPFFHDPPYCHFAEKNASPPPTSQFFCPLSSLRSNFWIWILAGAAIFLIFCSKIPFNALYCSILFLCQILGGPGDPTTLPSRSHSGGNVVGSQFHFLRRGLNKWKLGRQGDLAFWELA